jgi:hypothetical protein
MKAGGFPAIRRFPKIASQRIAITEPKMTVLNIRRFTGSGVGHVPKYPKIPAILNTNL